jgi:hypothetical protein
MLIVFLCFFKKEKETAGAQPVKDERGVPITKLIQAPDATPGFSEEFAAKKAPRGPQPNKESEANRRRIA